MVGVMFHSNHEATAVISTIQRGKPVSDGGKLSIRWNLAFLVDCGEPVLNLEQL